MIHRLLHHSIAAKFLLIILGMVAAFLVGTFAFYLPVVERHLFDSRRETLRHVVDSTHSLLGEYLQRVTTGELELHEAQYRAKQRIRHMRFGQGDYVWLNDTSLPYPQMLMHPTMPELEGRVMSDPAFNLVTRSQRGLEGSADKYSRGTKNLFQAFAEAVREDGRGFVSYWWQKPTAEGVTEEHYLKESYVRLFEPWGWIIGTGLYTDDIALYVRELRTNILTITFAALTLTIAFALIFTWSITRPISRLVGFADRVSSGDLEATVSGRFYGETGSLMQAITSMVQSLRDSLAQAEENRLQADARAEEARLASERLSVILRSIGDGVIAADTRGRVLFINRAAEELTGWSQRDAQNQPMDKVFAIAGRDNGPAPDLVKAAMENSAVAFLSEHVVLTAKDGTKRLIADSAAPIRDSEKRIIGVVVAFRDETEKQRLLDEAMKSEKLESLGILAGGIAHDFNNVLTAILGSLTSARLLLLQPEEASRKLDEAEKATYRARSLTSQLLTFAKGGAPVREMVSLHGLLDEVAGFATSGTSSTCSLSISDHLWAVIADRGQMEQVVHNLVLNAHHSMPGGGEIRISADNIDIVETNPGGLAPGAYVRVAVQDRGAGIEPAMIKKIFDPYFTTKPSGTGLGLTTCHSILKNHGGSIEVESSQGVGSTFRFYLPATKSEASLVDEIADDARIEGSLRVLVMDDEQMILDLIFDLLEHLGHEVVTARDGKDAVDFYSKAVSAGTPFDVVITDLTVPGGMGGKEAVKMILEIDPSAKVLVSSGYSMDPVMSEYRAHGFVGVLPKPYRLQDLANLLASVVSNRDECA